jgi:hypothetical protein
MPEKPPAICARRGAGRAGRSGLAKVRGRDRFPSLSQAFAATDSPTASWTTGDLLGPSAIRTLVSGLAPRSGGRGRDPVRSAAPATSSTPQDKRGRETRHLGRDPPQQAPGRPHDRISPAPDRR